MATLTLTDEQLAALRNAGFKLDEAPAPASAPAPAPAQEANGHAEKVQHVHNWQADAKGRLFCTDGSCGERALPIGQKGNPDMFESIMKSLNDIGHEGHNFFQCAGCRADLAKNIAGTNAFKVEDSLDFKNKSGRFVVEFKK